MADPLTPAVVPDTLKPFVNADVLFIRLMDKVSSRTKKQKRVVAVTGNSLVLADPWNGNVKRFFTNDMITGIQWQDVQRKSGKTERHIVINVEGEHDLALSQIDDKKNPPGSSATDPELVTKLPLWIKRQTGKVVPVVEVGPERDIITNSDRARKPGYNEKRDRMLEAIHDTAVRKRAERRTPKEESLHPSASAPSMAENLNPAPPTPSEDAATAPASAPAPIVQPPQEMFLHPASATASQVSPHGSFRGSPEVREPSRCSVALSAWPGAVESPRGSMPASRQSIPISPRGSMPASRQSMPISPRGSVPASRQSIGLSAASFPARQSSVAPSIAELPSNSPSPSRRSVLFVNGAALPGPSPRASQSILSSASKRQTIDPMFKQMTEQHTEMLRLHEAMLQKQDELGKQQEILNHQKELQDERERNLFHAEHDVPEVYTNKIAGLEKQVEDLVHAMTSMSQQMQRGDPEPVELIQQQVELQVQAQMMPPPPPPAPAVQYEAYTESEAESESPPQSLQDSSSEGSDFDIEPCVEVEVMQQLRQSPAPPDTILPVRLPVVPSPLQKASILRVSPPPPDMPAMEYIDSPRHASPSPDGLPEGLMSLPVLKDDMVVTDGTPDNEPMVIPPGKYLGPFPVDTDVTVVDEGKGTRVILHQDVDHNVGDFMQNLQYVPPPPESERSPSPYLPLEAPVVEIPVMAPTSIEIRSTPSPVQVHIEQQEAVASPEPLPESATPEVVEEENMVDMLQQMEMPREPTPVQHPQSLPQDLDLDVVDVLPSQNAPAVFPSAATSVPAKFESAEIRQFIAAEAEELLRLDDVAHAHTHAQPEPVHSVSPAVEYLPVQKTLSPPEPERPLSDLIELETPKKQIMEPLTTTPFDMALKRAVQTTAENRAKGEPPHPQPSTSPFSGSPTILHDDEQQKILRQQLVMLQAQWKQQKVDAQAQPALPQPYFPRTVQPQPLTLQRPLAQPTLKPLYQQDLLQNPAYIPQSQPQSHAQPLSHAQAYMRTPTQAAPTQTPLAHVARRTPTTGFSQILQGADELQDQITCKHNEMKEFLSCEMLKLSSIIKKSQEPVKQPAQVMTPQPVWEGQRGQRAAVVDGAKLLRESLVDVNRADRAMHFAEALAVLDMGVLVKVLGEFVPEHARGGLDRNWVSVIQQYQHKAAERLRVCNPPLRTPPSTLEHRRASPSRRGTTNFQGQHLMFG